jgi:replicative DNA helicase
VNDTTRETLSVIEGKRIPGIPTGFFGLDQIVQGLRKNEFTILAARPSMGKTSLATDIIINAAMEKKEPAMCGFFSIEMTTKAIIERMIGNVGGVNMFRIKGGYGNQTDAAKVMQVATRIAKARIHCDDNAGMDVQQIRIRARRWKKKRGVEFIVIDHGNLLHNRETARHGRQVEVASISSSIKEMAKELELPILLLVQLNRGSEERGRAGKPKLSDLRDSGMWEADADNVWLLRRPCKYEDDPDSGDRSLAVLEVAKQRNGPTGEVRFNFNEELTRFTDRTLGAPNENDALPTVTSAQEDLGIT